MLYLCLMHPKKVFRLNLDDKIINSIIFDNFLGFSLFWSDLHFTDLVKKSVPESIRIIKMSEFRIEQDTFFMEN